MASKDSLPWPLVIEAYGPPNLIDCVEERPGRLGWPRRIFGIDLYTIGEADCDLEIAIFDVADKKNSIGFMADFGWYNRGKFVFRSRQWLAKDERLSIRIRDAFFFTRPKGGYSTKYEFFIKH
ncbi:MAG TPA: hypothetical protein P5080_02400 [Candidatus Paceibacterota bacterium]|nr:hypothetical protein [Candidatus Pacearchaeota archaeon]HRZ50820.1 hypothetical protein [Candidatus Paceibacterota bacterium]HSA36541.1 hypothetical protein [Candidatus Paceibacterota bacterium]